MRNINVSQAIKLATQSPLEWGRQDEEDFYQKEKGGIMKTSKLMMMTNCKLNKSFNIRGTSFDRSVRYSPRVKEMWKVLYNSGTPVVEIAEMFGAYPRTVRVAVDSEYAEKYRQRRVVESKRYRSTHVKKKVVREDEQRGAYKKSILATMAHLVEV